MHARITRFRIKPESLSEVTARLPHLRGMISKIPGGLFNYAVWNDDGVGATFAVYESKDAADAAGSQIAEIWGALADHLAAPPEFESYAFAESMRD